MKDKINNAKLKSILKDYVVTRQTLMLITIALYVTDFSLSKPLYIMVLDMGDLLGHILALGMATLFCILPKVTAKLFAKKGKSRKLGFLAIICGLGLLSFIYIGQSEVVRQEANDPLNMLVNNSADHGESKTHIVATGLIGLLYTCAVFLSYIYYSDETKFRPKAFSLSMSKLARVFKHELQILQGLFDRAKEKPGLTASGKVNEYIRTLEKRERELEDKLFRQENARDYELATFENAKARITAAIKVAYKY